MNNSLPSASFSGEQISSQWPENPSFTSSNLSLLPLHYAYSQRLQQPERQIWAGKRGIFRPLQWDCTPATDILGSESFTLRLIVIWSGYIHSSGIFWPSQYDGSILSQPALCFFSSGTPPPALTRWECFKMASNAVKQQTIRQDSKVSFIHRTLAFRYLKKNYKVPIQTLVNHIFVTEHRLKARVTFAYISVT